MTTTASAISELARLWGRRVRLAVAVGLVWFILHFGVRQWLLPPGLHRPVSLTQPSSPVAATLASAATVIAGAYLGRLIIGTAYPCAGLLTAALALAFWPVGGGTMTEYLMLAAPNGTVGPPTGTAYLPLVGEYAVWLIVMVLAASADATPGPSSSASLTRRIGRRLRQILRPSASTGVSGGLLALAIATAIAGLLMLVLTGPPTSGNTLRGQVYFAVAVSSAAGVLAARRLTGVTEPIFYWPAPIAAGLVGTIVAAVRPDLMLPAPYNQLNSIPAWGLVRALPTEMVGVGISACWWALRVGRSQKAG